MRTLTRNKQKWCIYLLFVFALSIFSGIEHTVYAQNRQAVSTQQVKGKVVDQEGKPIPGVSVIVKGTSSGTTTDAKGEFTVRAASNVSLIFQFLGYEKQEYSVTYVLSHTVVMKEAQHQLEDVIVVGYGNMRKTDLSGAVGNLNSSVAKERQIMSIGDAIKGKLAGVVVTASDGQPGASNMISIRGNTSLSSDSEPLYVIDGVISEAQDVVPSQISEIVVLKDASSTAIYGSRGANGVILITTIAGKKESKPRVNVYAMYGVQQVANVLDLMNSEEYSEYKYLSYFTTHKGIFDITHQAFGDRDTQTTYFIDDEGYLWNVGRNAYYNRYYYQQDALPASTDWQKEIFQVAPIQDYRVTVSGGTNQSTYSVMFGRKKQEGLQIGSAYEDYSLRFNFRHNLTKKTTLGVNASLLRSAQDLSSVGNSMAMSPLHPADQERRVLPQDENAPPTWITNPLFYSKEISMVNKDINYSTTATLTHEFIKGLTLNLNASYITRRRDAERFYSENVNRAKAYSLNGVGNVTGKKVEELRSENTLNYDTKINKHAIGGMLGFSISSREWVDSFFENTNFPLTDNGIYGLEDGLTPGVPEYTNSKVNETSFFGRINYVYDDRYILKFTMRGDASSVFAANNKWAYFPSAAAAWRISQEKWMQNVTAISNLKLRFSWGVAGKQAISPYQSLALATLSKMTEDGVSYTGSSYLSQLGNRDLRWESTREANVGIDIGLWKDRIQLVVDAYEKMTTDLLYLNPLPQYTGFEERMENVGKVQNKGIEVSLYLKPVSTKNWNWDVSFNIARNVSKIKALGLQSTRYLGTGWGNSSDAVQGILQVGQPLGNWYGYKTDGIWQSWAEIREAKEKGLISSSANIYPGYIKYHNVDDNPEITNDDRVVLGNGFPDFTGGLSSTLSYKGISFSCTFQFSYGQDLFNATAWALDGISPSTASGNQYNRHMLNAWRPTLYYFDPVTGMKGDVFIEGNSSNRYPTQMNQRINNTEDVPLDWYIQDGSFLRLADVTLSYDLPQRWLKKVKIANARIFVSGTNLFLLTNYEGYDPEVNNSTGQASYLMPGLDNFAYPKARSYSMGLNITF